MKKHTILAIVFSVVMIFGVVLSGCSDTTDDTEDTTTTTTEDTADTTETTDTQETTDDTTDTESATEAWLEPFEETVYLTGVVGYDVDEAILEGTTPETNSILTLCSELLNIEIEILWSVSSDQYDEKLALTLASGSIPDLLFLESGDFYDFLNNGALMDLTDAWDTYASDEVVEIMNSVGGDPLEFCSSDGSLYAVPAVLNTTESCAMIYYRADWLENLGMDEPTTMEEVMEMFVAFQQDDPDGNGEDDTVGLVCYADNTLGTTMGLQAIYQSYGSYPGSWVLSDDGTVVSGTTLDTTKVALDALAELYANGGLAIDFATYDYDQAAETVISAKAGALSGSYWIPAGAMYQALDNDEDCEWACMQLVSSETEGAGEALSIKSENPIYYYNCVSATADEDAAAALVKIISLEMASQAHSSYDKTIFDGLEEAENGYALFYMPVYIYYPTPWTTYQTNIREAIETGDTSILTTQTQIDWYNYSIDYLENDCSEYGNISWGMYFSRISTEGGMGKALSIVEAGDYTTNVFYGEATETEVSVSSTLDDLTKNFFIDYIMGSKTDEDWEEFVSDWNELGGEAWTEEVNEGYNATH